jgi:hypothetical protein
VEVYEIKSTTLSLFGSKSKVKAEGGGGLQAVKSVTVPGKCSAISDGDWTVFPKNIPFPPKKRYLWRSAWCSTVQGSRHTWTLKNNIVSHIVSFPPLNYPPSMLAVLLVVMLVVVLLCHRHRWHPATATTAATAVGWQAG